jgi:hypothetical protein
MKNVTRDLLAIVFSTAVVLGCGFAAGSHLAKRGAARQAAAPPTVALAELEGETLAALRRSLDLTPAQEPVIAPELAAFGADVFDTRERAMLEYHDHLLRLHDRLMPKLEPAQQEILRKNRARLQETIERRFPPAPDSR